MGAKSYYSYIKLFLCRNSLKIDRSRAEKNKINLEWVNNGNIGDSLGPIIYNWMLKEKNIDINTFVKKANHIITCGSLIGAGSFDAVVWGSGIHNFDNMKSLIYKKRFRRYDIRAVRGPITYKLLTDCGYSCPSVFGDPAILMPNIYTPNIKKKYACSVIIHYKSKGEMNIPESCHCISPETTDYQSFINEINASERVISSSLHGIILSETYGIPAVFLNIGKEVNDSLMKYYDWYFSTKRYNVIMAQSIEEAMELKPMNLPNLDNMRDDLIRTFPYDLWGGVNHKYCNRIIDFASCYPTYGEVAA